MLQNCNPRRYGGGIEEGGGERGGESSGEGGVDEGRGKEDRSVVIVDVPKQSALLVSWLNSRVQGGTKERVGLQLRYR